MQQNSLTLQNWLDCALSELRDNGYERLKAQPLAKKLGVTRGSFYHHFESLEDFHTRIISHWSNQTTGKIIVTVQQSQDPKTALRELLSRTLQSGEALERAMRSWSTVQPDVAREVEKVDLTRIAFARDLLLNGGIPEKLAAPRAKLLYWAAIGRLMLPVPENNRLSPEEISELAHLMMTPET